MTKLIENMGPRHCRWVTDQKTEDKRTLYCAEATRLGTEYCPVHFPLMYRSEAAVQRHRQLLPSFRQLRKVA